MNHIITAVVENQPGVLARVVGIISGRGYNIATLTVGPTTEPDVSQMTMTVPGDDHVLQQVTQQLNKMVEVIKVTDLTGKRHVSRELLLIALDTTTTQRAEIVELAALFNADVVAVGEESISIELVGTPETIDDFLKLTRHCTLIDCSRSGITAIAHGN